MNNGVIIHEQYDNILIWIFQFSQKDIKFKVSKDFCQMLMD